MSRTTTAAPDAPAAPAPDAPDAPAPDAPATNAAPAPDLLAPYKHGAPRKVRFEVIEGSPRADVPALRATEYVPAPVVLLANDRDGVPVLLLANGTQMKDMPLSAIGEAIIHGVLPRDEVLGLLGLPLDL